MLTSWTSFSYFLLSFFPFFLLFFFMCFQAVLLRIYFPFPFLFFVFLSFFVHFSFLPPLQITVVCKVFATSTHFSLYLSIFFYIFTVPLYFLKYFLYRNDYFHLSKNDRYLYNDFKNIITK